MIEMQIDVMEMLGTFFSWFVIIVVIALVFGVIMMILRIFFWASIIGGLSGALTGGGNRRSESRNVPCPHCGRYTPPDSAFCKNCGSRIR